MNKLLDQFVKAPFSQKIAMLVMLYAVVIAGYVYLGYMPKSEELEGLLAQQQQLTQEKDKMAAIAENLDRFKLEVEALNEALNKALKELPNQREIDKLLRRISTIGKKIGLEFLLFQPLPEVVEGFYAQVPVKIEVSGSYHEVAMFFDRIGKLSRIVNVSDIQMAVPAERGGKIILKTGAKATTYRFLEPEEAKSGDEEGEKKPAPAGNQE